MKNTNKIFGAVVILLVLLCVAASPSFQSFMTTQFAIVGNKVSIKGHAFVTNMHAYGRIEFPSATGSSNYLFTAGDSFIISNAQNAKVVAAYGDTADGWFFYSPMTISGALVAPSFTGSFTPTNVTASRLLASGTSQITNSGIVLVNGTNVSKVGSLSAGDNITTTAGVIGTTGQFGSLTVTGPVNQISFTATNGNITQTASDNNTSDNLTNWVGLYYFASGGTNQVDMNRYGDFMLTNNMATNITLWLTNGAPGKRFAINILGPTNGNNYTLTIYSANSWLMAWDRNCATNGGTGSILTVTNNQSLEVNGWLTKTPSNPIVNMVWGRKTL